MRASERVYRALREEIVAWHLPPGTELGEVEQAARWGVSRTPLREALGRLAAEGLAVVGRGRTLVVSQLDADDVVHLFELREALETQAARLAARRARPELFTALAERLAGAGDLLVDDDPDRTAYYALVGELDDALDAAMASRHLQRSLVALRAHVARVRRLAHADTARLLRAAEEHRLIAEAVAAGDPVLAAQATAVHLHASLTHVLDALTCGVAGGQPLTGTAVRPLTAPADRPAVLDPTGAAR
ncbi:GntR family transcriptional regulator [Actinotalea sp. Marseille-Q4924]|uniref:GntR family transcriptional regulator n=1 Tax=Actinotalea sp. Marseille-Q4924 TaxID=2866571 RepID=UPI001CE466A1|nr:GntR family transcriptional regulator [Actinotalea sp. Marseille-Q4924]